MKAPFYIAFLLIWTAVTSFGQTIVVDSMEHQGYERKYTVHLPQGFTGTSSIPAVIMLHGGGGTMQNAQGFTEFNRFSNDKGFVAVYPQGYAEVQNGYAWADGRGTAADQAGIDDIGFIEKLLDVLENDYAADPESLYVCGFSNGGFMTQTLACRANERFAAMASLGSTMDTVLFPDCNPGRAIPMLLLLGTKDPFVPYNGGEMIGSGNVNPIVHMDSLTHFWKTNNGCHTAKPANSLPEITPNDPTSVTVFEYTDCDCDNSEVKLYKIEEGGHTWPGVPNPVYELIAGPTNRDIHASQELWNFFSRFERCLPSTGIEKLAEPCNITIYPNPTSNAIYIDTQSNDPIAYELKNMQGQEIEKGLYNGAVSLELLPPGLYILNVILGEKTIVKKVIKR